MLMRMPLLTFAGAVFLCAGAGHAQTGAIPDAPAPAANGGRLNLSVPAKPLDVTPSPKPKPATVCDGPAEGVYASGNYYDTGSMPGQGNAYMRNVSARVLTNWNRVPRHDFSNHIGPGHSVKVRFAIRPDGSYFMPEVTRSSGNAADDEKAMAAIRDVPSFPPLPDGITKPVVMCIAFGYNMTSDEMGYDQRWLDKAVGEKKPETR